MKIGISKEFIKYCLVGIVNTTVGCLTAFIALNILHFNYYVSTTLSYITGVSCSFILNKKYTFKDNDENVFWQFAKMNITFIPIYVLSYWFLGNNLTYWFFRHFPETVDFCVNIINTLFKYPIPKNIFIDDVAVCISIIINLVLAFTAVRAFVFTKKENVDE